MIKVIQKIIDKLKRNKFELPPATVEKDENPVKYLSYPTSQIAGHNSVTITSNDYLCLQAEQFLNDVIIDFYLKYLQVGKWPQNPMLQKTYIFSIYFYSRLATKTSMSANIPKCEVMHNNVKKWTKNVNIFEKDFIVIPINECEHWFVVIVCFVNSSSGDSTKKPIMIVMDSLEDGLKSTVCSNIRSYLTSEWQVKMKTKKEFTKESLPVFCPCIPQQPNLTDCGLYLLQYVESFYQKPFTDYSIPLKNVEFWFTAEVIQQKRHDIAKLIRNLSASTNNKEVKFPDLDFGVKLIIKKEKPDPITDSLSETTKNFNKMSESCFYFNDFGTVMFTKYSVKHL